MKLLFTYFMVTIIVTACSNIKPNENRDDDKLSQMNQDTIDWSKQNVCLENLEKYDVDKNEWEHEKLEFYRNKKDGQTYLLTCETEYGPVWHQVPFRIDFETYQDFGRYSMDNNNVYYRFYRSDGDMIFKLDTADRETFTALGISIYAKDKNYVYRRGDIIKNADPRTFEVLDFKAGPPIGRDRNHVYIWDEILQDTTEIEGLREYLEKNK